jgi:hypothetical protein
MSSFGNFCQNISVGLRIDLHGLLGAHGLSLDILAKIGLDLGGSLNGLVGGLLGGHGGGLLGGVL